MENQRSYKEPTKVFGTVWEGIWLSTVGSIVLFCSAVVIVLVYSHFIDKRLFNINNILVWFFSFVFIGVMVLISESKPPVLTEAEKSFIRKIDQAKYCFEEAKRTEHFGWFSNSSNYLIFPCKKRCYGSYEYDPQDHDVIDTQNYYSRKMESIVGSVFNYCRDMCKYLTGIGYEHRVISKEKYTEIISGCKKTINPEYPERDEDGNIIDEDGCTENCGCFIGCFDDSLDIPEYFYPSITYLIEQIEHIKNKFIEYELEVPRYADRLPSKKRTEKEIEESHKHLNEIILKDIAQIELLDKVDDMNKKLDRSIAKFEEGSKKEEQRLEEETSIQEAIRLFEEEEDRKRFNKFVIEESVKELDI